MRGRRHRGIPSHHVVSDRALDARPPRPRPGAAAARRRLAAPRSRAGDRLGVFLQVYLIGAYIFGAGSDALDAHTNLGFTVHGLEVLLLLVALAAWLPRADVGLSLL